MFDFCIFVRLTVLGHVGALSLEEGPERGRHLEVDRRTWTVIELSVNVLDRVSDIPARVKFQPVHHRLQLVVVAKRIRVLLFFVVAGYFKAFEELFQGEGQLDANVHYFVYCELLQGW